MCSRRKRSPEEQARREMIRELLQSSGVSSMEDNEFKDIETLSFVFQEKFINPLLS